MFPPGYKGYQAGEDEPTVFTSHKDRVAFEWTNWMSEKLAKAGRVVSVHPEDKETVLMMANMLKQGLRNELHFLTAELPDEPPSMWTPNGQLSQRWVMDIARRDGMTPEEVCSLAYALNRQQVQYDQGIR